MSWHVRACVYVCVCMNRGTPGMALSRQGGRHCSNCYFLSGGVLTPSSCSGFPCMEHSFSLFLNLLCPGPAGLVPALGGLS